MTEEQEGTDMNREQYVRVEAIRSASQVLGRKSEGAFKAVTPPDVSDLVDLAEYIVCGVHPMDRYRESR